MARHGEVRARSESGVIGVDWGKPSGGSGVSRTSYPSDVTDEQWAVVEPLLARNGVWGRPREVDLREIVNAIFYLVRTGCHWRFLPHDFPHPSSVH